MRSHRLVGEGFVDTRLQLFRQCSDMGFLEHTCVSSRDVVGPYTPSYTPAPAEEGIFVALDVGFVGTGTASRPEQQDLAVEWSLRAIVLLGKQINGPHRYPPQ